MRQAGITLGLTNKEISILIQYLDPDYADNGTDRTMTTNSDISVGAAILWIFVLALGILMSRI